MIHFTEFKVDSIVLDQEIGGPFVLLREVEGGRTLRIQVSLGDAAAMMAAHEGIEFPRPLTHDLMVSVLNGLSVRVTRTAIVDLSEDVFIGELVVESGGTELVFDCRSSDAINIALRMDTPIQVAAQVLDKIENIDREEATKKGWMNLLAMLTEEQTKESEKEN